MILDQAAETECGLVDEWLTGQYSIAQFTAHCHQLVDILDPDGAKPRDENLKAKSFIHETWLPNGMLRILAELDPQRAAFYQASMRAKTNPRRPTAPGEPAEDDANHRRGRASDLRLGRAAIGGRIRNHSPGARREVTTPRSG